MKKASGFTLLELLVGIFLTGLLVRMGVVASASILDTYQLNYTINQLQSDIARLRSQALATGCPQTLEVAADGASYSGRASSSCFSGDFQPDDLNSFTRAMSSNVRLGVGSPILVNSRGFVVDLAGQPSAKTVNFLCRGAPCATQALSILGVLS